ncbi:hypothetical protein LGN07_16595 [Burkholderia cepacia]|uniref:hypothetical protein n=1 Tax=Burkholderia cepacia TaxID=292 RepID=UPI0012D9E7E2|nr:hypothetical protein [Burkholderia cepacia]MCA8120340.1 hypothetical protein [Burkholderia cepacia]
MPTIIPQAIRPVSDCCRRRSQVGIAIASTRTFHFKFNLQSELKELHSNSNTFFFKESFRPAQPGVAPENHAPARSGNCQLSGRRRGFRMTIRRSLHGDVIGAVHLGAEDSKEKILSSNFI